MKVVEINRVLDSYLKNSNKEGKFIVRKKVSANKLIPSLRTICLELYLNSSRIISVSETSKSTTDETDTSNLCEELLCKVLLNWENIKNDI